MLVALVAPAPSIAAAKSSSKSTNAAKQARQRQIGQQLKTLKSQVAEASADEERLLDALDASDQRLGDLNTQVGAADARILATERELDAAQSRLDALEAQFQQARDRLERVRSQLVKAHQELLDRAVSAYTQGPLLSAYTDAFFGGGTREAAARSGYLDTVVREQSATVERYRLLRDQAVDLAESLDESRSQALGQRDVVAGRKAELEQARGALDGVRQQVRAESDQRTRLLSEVRSRKAEFEAQIAALQAESSAITELLKARQAGQSLAVSGKGVLAPPIPGARITSSFGPRTHPIFGDVRVHTGIDFGAGSGTPIHAAGDGEVVFAGPRGGYGNATIIDHNGSLATLYGHQSRILVGEGQHVTRGQVIGLVGATGFATGPHLHFEVRVAGAPVDPLSYL